MSSTPPGECKATCPNDEPVPENSMDDEYDEILDSLFHGCALAAYIDQMRAEQHWPPDCEATKHRANRYYEEELAAKNRQQASPKRTHTASAVLHLPKCRSDHEQSHTADASPAALLDVDQPAARRRK